MMRTSVAIGIFLSIVVLAATYSAVHAQNPSRRERMELYGEVEDASELRPGEDPDERIRRNFFLRAEVSKTTCYVGEPLMATFKAYSRLDANSQVIKRPSLSGFSVVEMVDAYNNEPEVEKFNGDYYYVHLIRKVQLFPLQPGDFVIESAEVESSIQLRSSEERGNGMRLRHLFRRRGDPALRRQMVFKTPEVTVHVKSLPELNQPPDFAGAVGNFRVELISGDSLAIQHEASKITLRIMGSGNFPLITNPDVSWPAGFTVQEPMVDEQVNKYEFPLAGVKSFVYTVNNTDTGTFTIPAVRFTWFDPASASYKSDSSSVLTWHVSAADKKQKTLPFIANRKTGGIPMHYYYFGVVVIVIIAVIVYMAVKKRES